MFIWFDLRIVLLLFSFFCIQMLQVNQNCFAVIKKLRMKIRYINHQVKIDDFMEDKTLFLLTCVEKAKEKNFSFSG